ncbi:hypothetical protein GH733_003213 [Mirounga leonina]|nr:hypothetical protein GH733_003213 [Mirounga leonina]
MDSLVEPRWPPGLAVMKTIDDLLRCGICFEYFNIAMMIPQCSHNYCSLCIRKFLSYKTQCPTCCVTVTEPDLKNNRILDELKEVSTSSKTKETPIEKAAPCSLDAHVPETPSTSTLKQVTKDILHGNHGHILGQHALKQWRIEEVDIMVFTKDQTEKEIDEIHSKYRVLIECDPAMKQFLLYLDELNALGKKFIIQDIDGTHVFVIAELVNVLQERVEQEDKKMKFSDTSPITNHFSQSKLESPGRMESDRPDDSSSCTDIQEEACSSSDSDSFNRQESPGIVKYIGEALLIWAVRNDLQDTEMSPRQNRRTRSVEGAEIEPRNKRNRN